MLHICSWCYADTVFICEGTDDDKGIFKLYECPNCHNFVRDFTRTEREVVLDEIEAENEGKC